MIVRGDEFRNEVKKRLIDMGMTQQKLADDLGIRASYLSDILLGNRSGAEYLPRIISILGFENEACVESKSS